LPLRKHHEDCCPQLVIVCDQRCPCRGNATRAPSPRSISTNAILLRAGPFSVCPLPSTAPPTRGNLNLPLHVASGFPPQRTERPPAENVPHSLFACRTRQSHEAFGQRLRNPPPARAVRQHGLARYPPPRPPPVPSGRNGASASTRRVLAQR